MKEETYLKGYREGFESGLKIAWAYAEVLLTKVQGPAREQVKDFIEKLKA